MGRRGFLAAAAGATALGTLALTGGGSAVAATAAQPERATCGAAGLIGIQLWTVRADLTADHDETIEYLADAGYGRVELALGLRTHGGGAQGVLRQCRDLAELQS